MQVEIVVVKYNQPGYEARCLASIAMFTQEVDYSLTAHQNAKGVGLATVWNKLIQRSEAEYICLLNNDTVVTPGWLVAMVDVMEGDPTIGAVVPSTNLSAAGQIKTPLPREEGDIGKIAKWGTECTARYDDVLDLDVLSATCMAFPRRVWEEAGGFDERFFFYGEDSEFTWRIKNTYGHRLCHVKGAYIHHYKAKSMGLAVSRGELDLPASLP